MAGRKDKSTKEKGTDRNILGIVPRPKRGLNGCWRSCRSKEIHMKQYWNGQIKKKKRTR
jgi:hypothetical protein